MGGNTGGKGAGGKGRKPKPKEEGPPEKTKAEIEQEQRALLVINQAKKEAVLREQREALRSEVKPADEKLALVMNPKTMRPEKVPEVDKHWLDKSLRLLPCLRGDDGSGPAALQTAEFLQALEADFDALLNMPHGVFWSHAVHDVKRLRKCLDAYLQHPPGHEGTARALVCIYLRLSQRTEGPTAFLSKG